MEENIPVFEGDERIFKKRVEIYFGSVSSQQLEEELNKRAIDLNYSLTYLLNNDFKAMADGLIRHKGENGGTYFDALFSISSEIYPVYSPKMEVGSYAHNGFKYPMLILKDGYLRDSKKQKRFFLRDEFIDKFGKEFEYDAGYEYCGFKRV